MERQSCSRNEKRPRDTEGPQKHTRSLSCARHLRTSMGECRNSVKHRMSGMLGATNRPARIPMAKWNVDDPSHGSTWHNRSSWRNRVRLCVWIGVLFPVFRGAGTTSSVLDMTPPISRLALADLRDTFEEVHNEHRGFFMTWLDC